MYLKLEYVLELLEVKNFGLGSNAELENKGNLTKSLNKILGSGSCYGS